MRGYKATDRDMRCRGHQFEIGVWYEHTGDLVMCESGFHFCEHLPGTWAYYNQHDDRRFEIEAEGVLEAPKEPGSRVKLVCRRIRFVREIQTPVTGDGNAGSWNTGGRNAGSWNAGGRNAGSWNAGSWNTGDGNAGDGNAGPWNTGDGNTGSWNTGSGNAGSGNAGSWNTGDGNTGSGNATDRCAGFFCSREPAIVSFDVDTGLTRHEYLHQYPQALELGRLLIRPEPIPFQDFAAIPGITPEKLIALHQAHLAARSAASPKK